MAVKVAIAADHGGFELKNHIALYLKEKGIDCVDLGTNEAQSVDYPDYAEKACKLLVSGECDYVLLFCTTGVGMSMAANKFKGARACCCSDTFSAEMTRRHNNANVLCLGQAVVGNGLAKKIVDIFLSTEFEEDNERHARRVGKISELEN